MKKPKLLTYNQIQRLSEEELKQYFVEVYQTLKPAGKYAIDCIMDGIEDGSIDIEDNETANKICLMKYIEYRYKHEFCS